MTDKHGRGVEAITLGMKMDRSNDNENDDLLPVEGSGRITMGWRECAQT